MGFSVITKPCWLPPAPAATSAATGGGSAAVASADGADGADAADDDAADTHDSVEHCSPQSVAMATSAIATAHTDDGVRQAAAESNPCQPASTQSWHVPWCAPPSPTAAVDATATAAATAVSTA